MTNTSGGYNQALGYQALLFNTTGMRNSAVGGNALLNNTDGGDNLGMGDRALFANTGGDRNLAIGSSALTTLKIYNDNTALGYNALKLARGARNVAVGSGAGRVVSAGSDNIEIGNIGAGPDSRTIRIGTQGTQTATYLAGVSGTSIPGPVETVVVNGDGQLGTASVDLTALLARLDRQEREIAALRREVRGR